MAVLAFICKALRSRRPGVGAEQCIFGGIPLIQSLILEIHDQRYMYLPLKKITSEPDV